MKYPDFGVGLAVDRAPSAHSALLDLSLDQAREDLQNRQVANRENREPEPFLDFRDPYKAEPVIASRRVNQVAPEQSEGKSEHEHEEEKVARERRRERREEKEDKEWWEVAGDWIGGAVDVATQVVIGAAEEVYEAITERPLETLGMLATGAAIGVCVGAAVPVATLLAAPAAVIGGITLATDVTAYGAWHAGNSVVKAVDESAESAGVLMNQLEYSIAEIQAAREDLQDKTGAAAIEAGFSLVTAPFAVGNGVRLVREPGNYFKIKPSAVEDGTVPTAANTVEPVAQPVNEAVPQVQAANELVIEAAMLAHRGEAPYLKNADFEAYTKLLEIPADAGPELNFQIDHVLAQREAVVDLGALAAKLESTPRTDLPVITISDGAGGTRKLTREEIFEIDETIELLQGTPQAKVYDEWFNKASARAKLENEVFDELATRRELVKDVINKNMPLLFPDGVVSTLRVEKLRDGASQIAGYLDSAVWLKDKDLFRPSYLRESVDGRRPIEFYTHELRHAEQDGLLIRNLIDRVTGGDTTGRPLTSSEIDDVIEMGFDKYNWRHSIEQVEDINTKRAGRVLNESEATRAQMLELSRSEVGDGSRYMNQMDTYLTNLETVTKRIEDGMSPSIFFSPDYQAKLYDGIPIPEVVGKLDDIYRTRLKPFDGNYTEEQAGFAEYFKLLLLEAIKHEKRDVAEGLAAAQKRYEGWFHEREAFHVGKQASMELTNREILSGERLQESVDEMMLNPIDYSEVFAY
jgi:hypothetical protein